MKRARYEYIAGSSAKFWEFEVIGDVLRTSWGRIGTPGQTKDTEFASLQLATAAAQKAAASKVKKGYVQARAVAKKSSKKAATKKAATKKAATKKAATKKAATKKAATKKAATKKAATKKAATKKAATKKAATRKAATKQAATKKAATKKAATKKAATKQAATKKAATKKAATKKAATKKATQRASTSAGRAASTGPGVKSVALLVPTVGPLQKDGVEVRWTKELRKELAPIRGHHRRPRTTELSDKVLSSAAAKVEGAKTPELTKLIGDKIRGPERWKLEAHLASVVRKGAVGEWEPMVDRWVARYGLGNALRMLPLLEREGVANRWGQPTYRTAEMLFAPRFREWAAVASDDEFDAAVDVGRELLDAETDDESIGAVACALAYILPLEEPVFFEPAVESGPARHLTNQLYQAVMNEEQLDMLYVAMEEEEDYHRWHGAGGVWLAHRFGAEGFRLLNEHCVVWGKAALIATLPYVGREPAKALSEWLGWREVARRISEYMLAVPAIALEVLPQVIEAGEPDAKKAARTLLRQVEAKVDELSVGEAASTVAGKSDESIDVLLRRPPWREVTSSWPWDGVVAKEPAIACPKGKGKLPEDAHVHQLRAKRVSIKRAPGQYKVDASWVRNKDRLLPPEDAVAVFGAAAVPGLLEVVRTNAVDNHHYQYGMLNYFEQWLSIGAAGFAPHAASFLQRKDLRSLAERWIAAHPAHALSGLVPMLAAKPGRARDEAHLALLWIRRRMGDRELRTLAKKVRVEAAMQAWLALDPAALVPHKAATLPKFVQARSVKTRSGARASSEALLELASFARRWNYDVGAAAARESFDPESLDELSRSMVEAWLGAGAKSANAWLANSAGLYGSNALVPWLKAQARDRIQARDRFAALVLLEQLMWIDTPSARLEVLRHYRSGRAAWLRRGVEEQLLPWLADRGIPLANYEADAIPELPAELSFGKVRHRVAVRAEGQHQPVLLDDDGRPLARAPRGSAAEKARWEEVKSDGSDLLVLTAHRLEQMLIDGEPFELDVFRRLAAHAIVGGLFEHVLFAVGRTTFRVCEDGSFASVNDESYVLPKRAKVAVAHPAELSGKQLGAWREIFSDYERLAPFPQLHRTIEQPLPDKPRKVSLWDGAPIHPGRFLQLGRFGWKYDASADGPIAAYREFSGARKPVRVAIQLSGSIDMARVAKSNVELRALSFEAPSSTLTKRSAFEIAYVVEGLTAG
ncbi:MAG: DUF4132 domain-containing protein [Myxococcota bacterium]